MTFGLWNDGSETLEGRWRGSFGFWGLGSLVVGWFLRSQPSRLGQLECDRLVETGVVWECLVLVCLGGLKSKVRSPAVRANL